MFKRALLTLAAAFAAVSISMAAESGTYDYDPKGPTYFYDKINGISALEINGNNESITVTQGKQSSQDYDYNLKNAAGAKKKFVVVKIGEEFQIESKDWHKRFYRVDKISDGYIYMSVSVKYNKKNAEHDESYRCKSRPFGGK